MVKKELIFSILLVLLLIPFTSAVNQTLVDDGYNCLNEKIDEKGCSDLSLEEQIFSSLSTGKCTGEIVSSSESQEEGECWSGGASECQVDLTAKAILALDKSGESTENAVNWLSSKNKTTENLRWYLQAEASEEPATCDISYEGNNYAVEIGEDKKFSSEAGNCLLLSDSGYWLVVSPQCYGTEFEISCNSSFSTNLLFSEQESSTLNVLGETSSASSGGTTTEEVSSLCFEEGGRCSYEGTLWASTILNYLGRDISHYKPYLIALKNNQRQYLPSSFLYSITGKSRYADELMNRRSPAGYWQQSGERYYDTSLAMYFLQGSGIQGLVDTEDWLIEQQDDSGCWNDGNIRDTAFILHSTWPKSTGSGGGDSETVCYDIEDADCVYSDECGEGNELTEYSTSCPGNQVCCDVPEDQGETCEELAGEQEGNICDEYNDEYCSGGEERSSASDLDYGEICCVGGTCEVEEEPQENDTEDDATCEENGGTCRTWDCEDDEEESFSYSCEGGDTCCVPSDDSSGIGWWVWVLIVLVILAGLGIIFKDKLKEWWLKIKSKSGKNKGGRRSGPRGPGGRPPGHPPGRPPQGRPRNVPRRIMPKQSSPQGNQQQRPPQRRPRKSSKELDETLGKLREMSK